MRGFSPPHGTWVGICGTDLVRTNDGFKVLEDNLRVPSGVSYMLANRNATKSSLRRLYRRSRVMEVEHYGRELLETLRELAPEERSEPSIALLTPGVYNSAFYEHVFLAHELGAELVEGQDLLVNNGFVYMRTTAGLERVDVIYRRVDDDFIDPSVLSLSRSPCLIEDAIEPRHVDLRPFVLHGRETRIVPGAFCRVALRQGSLVVNSSQGGGGKDFWVLEE